MSRGKQATVTAGYRIEQDLRLQIANGELRPGDKLPSETDLSAQYGVSRNTMREAVRALAGQGLLEVKRGVAGGTFVAQPSVGHISSSLQTHLAMLADVEQVSVAHLLQAREMLEVPAAEVAALNRTDDDLAELHHALFDPQHVDTSHVFTDTRGFHVGILKATHNPLLTIVAEPIFRVLDERFLRERAPKEVWTAVDADHREILGYLEQRDQAGAREALRAHLRAARGYYAGMEQD